MSNLSDDLEQSDFSDPYPLDRRIPKSSSSAPLRQWNYEASVVQIEAIINRIEMGELELAEVFDEFAIAVEHLRQCETFLTHQKQQMDLLIETLLDEPETF